MNEPKSARYHRLSRRADLVSLATMGAVSLGMLWLKPNLSFWAYALVYAAALSLAALPAGLYAFQLEQRYQLSTESLAAWYRSYLKSAGLLAIILGAVASVVYRFMRSHPEGWWFATGAVYAVTALLLTWLGPVVILPLIHRSRPLERPSLRERLLALSRRAGVRALGVYEWGMGGHTRRANALLAGWGGTRRIYVSDTLLAEHSDDEIEVILAHELAHHVHRDIPKAFALDVVVLFATCYITARVVDLSWEVLRLSGPADHRGMPILVLASGAVALAVKPLMNAWSRAKERRADRYALDLTQRPEAFVSAMRRLGAQNLSEENPSPLAVWLFHTHPPVEERIAAARSKTNAATAQHCTSTEHSAQH